MKQAIGGAIAVIGIAWLLFVFTSPDSCDRIKRGAAPVRVTMDFTRWATQNWLSIDARINMLRWSVKADEAAQSFLSNQFYAQQVCKVPASKQADSPENQSESAN